MTLRASRGAAAVVLAWLLVLAAVGASALGALRVSGDLRLFMPAPRSADQRLLMDELGEGPGARMLLMAISGAQPDQRSEASANLVAALSGHAELRFIDNGTRGIDAIPEHLAPYRYLLGPSADAADAFTARDLRSALQARLRDLASPAGALLAPLIPRDPTLAGLALLEAWAGQADPARYDGAWTTRDGESALLVAETRAPGFDPAGQQLALEAIREAFDAQPKAAGLTLEISGPGAFAERMARRTAAEAGSRGALAGVLLLLLLASAYRSLRLPLLAALPLASAVVAALTVTAMLFDAIHGITLAFGFTLLGVAQDYPAHLLSHRRPDETPEQTARCIWPPLATGAASSALAYVVFLFAGVEGLRQLACFTITGLLVAAATTRWLLPRILPPATTDLADRRLLHRAQQALGRAHRARWVAAGTSAALALALMLAPGPWWQDDLGRLTPVPQSLIERDRALRAELGAAELRWLLAVRAPDADAALTRSAALVPQLDELVQRGVLGGYDLAARYLPPASVQRARQLQLPDPTTARAALDQALVGLPFRHDAFAPFLDDLEQARTLPPLTPERLEGTPLALRVDSLLRVSGDGAVALVSLNGLTDASALAGWAASQPQVQLLDLKTTAQSLASAWRGRLLAAMAVAAVLLAVALRLALGGFGRAARVLLPVALGSAMLLGVLHASGEGLHLFHLISLVLAAGLGLDYALFLERAGEDPRMQRRTLHALGVCAASTLLVFGLLASSSIPVLHAIGTTVAWGVVLHAALAGLLASRPAAAGQSGDD